MNYKERTVRLTQWQIEELRRLVEASTGDSIGREYARAYIWIGEARAHLSEILKQTLPDRDDGRG